MRGLHRAMDEQFKLYEEYKFKYFITVSQASMHFQHIVCVF